MSAKGEKTRRAIVEAAIPLFASHGAHWVSFQKIGDCVGLKQASLYAYFKDKDDLLAACCEYVNQLAVQYIDSRCDSDLGAEAQLKAYALANLQWVFKFPDHASALMAMFYFSSYSPRMAELQRAIEAGGVLRIRTHLIQGTREKAWAIREPGRCARMVQSFLTGELIKAFRSPKELTLRQREELIWEAIQGFLVPATS